eukprot:CAMPEP_0182438364 /NCGR_PEP_ID=MMETSP1167-20130531/85712_1 /TAXON_ID=2988 /ORGANISM="Mallomonas Sp, Strain CCMP3275" /LENGTH=520 /DNA_ID=CAMNT_0024631687 /DNA_START=608 /DNA_END=2170 /DNA_ORIENTATION=-
MTSSPLVSELFGGPITGSSDTPIKVPKKDPLRQSTVPPEVVFFGEPRRPPPIEAAGDPKYHGSLLMWARHATVAPRTSEERVQSVFPKGRLHPEALKYRLSAVDLTYEKILTSFVEVEDDLEAAKDFISSNIDLVPSMLFMRALTADKLKYQSLGELEKMEEMKRVREKYMLAHDQLFFPLNIEIMKAETRVMTYLARDELSSYAGEWDEVEASLHFITLLAARYTWDEKVNQALDRIKSRIDNTISYMREVLASQLMSREFRKPATTAQVYENATDKIATNMPELYKKILPEVRVVYETYRMNDPEEIRNYITKVFCVRNNSLGCAPELLRENLKRLDASISAIQDINYTKFRLRVRELYNLLCNPLDPTTQEQWYINKFKDGYGFDTYEPDVIPTIVQAEQRIRDTGNAFDNFKVDVLKGPTNYTPLFSGERKKGTDVGNWLERDPDWNTPQVASYEERLSKFRESYIIQTNLRMSAETSLDKRIDTQLDGQERESKRERERKRRELIIQITDDEEEE